MCQRQNLEIFQLRNSEDLETALSNTKPVALAWDLSNAQPGDWTLVRRLRHYPNLSQAPFILYGQLAEEQVGMTGFRRQIIEHKNIAGRDHRDESNPGNRSDPDRGR